MITSKSILDRDRFKKMHGFWPNAPLTPEEQFKDLIGAIKLRDDGYIIQTLNKNPNLLQLQDANGDTLFHHVAKEGCSKTIFHYFLENDSQSNLQNDAGFTVHHYLAYYNRAEYLSAFLKQHPTIDLNAKTKNNETGAYLAAYNGSTEALQVLIKHGIDVNLPNNQNQTPLHLACFQGHQHCIILLLMTNTTINAIDNHGRTPLHYLAQNSTLNPTAKSNVLDYFNCLLSQFNTKCHSGFTASQHAHAFGDHELAEMLDSFKFPTLSSLCAQYISENFELYQNKLDQLPEVCQDEILLRYNLIASRQTALPLPSLTHDDESCDTKMGQLKAKSFM